MVDESLFDLDDLDPLDPAAADRLGDQPTPREKAKRPGTGSTWVCYDCLESFRAGKGYPKQCTHCGGRRIATLTGALALYGSDWKAKVNGNG